VASDCHFCRVASTGSTFLRRSDEHIGLPQVTLTRLVDRRTQCADHWTRTPTLGSLSKVLRTLVATGASPHSNSVSHWRHGANRVTAPHRAPMKTPVKTTAGPNQSPKFRLFDRQVVAMDNRVGMVGLIFIGNATELRWPLILIFFGMGLISFGETTDLCRVSRHGVFPAKSVH
jgi:hypothetical protein